MVDFVGRVWHLPAILARWLAERDKAAPEEEIGGPVEEQAVEEHPPEKHVDFLLDEVRRALDAQWQQWDNLEARIRFLFTLIAAAITVVLSVVVGRGGAPQPPGAPQLLSGWTLGMLVLAGIAVVGSLVFLAWAYWPTSFYRPPDPVPLVDTYASESTLETKLVLIYTIAAAYDLNRGRLDRNWFRFQAAFGCLGLSAILVLVGLLLGVAR